MEAEFLAAVVLTLDDGRTENSEWDVDNPVVRGSLFSDRNDIVAARITEGVTTIGSGAFWGCSSLASVKIPVGVTTIEEFAFASCSSLASVTIPVGVTAINNATFYECISLASVTIPEGVTTIGDSAFEGCSSLASVTIPEGVTTIREGAFFGCTSLVAVSLPRGIFINSEDYFDPDNNIKLLVMHYRDHLLWGHFAQDLAPNAVFYVYKHDDGRIEVKPGPAARLLPAIASPVANNIIADPKVLTPFWNSVVPAQRARLQRTVLELRQWQKGIPAIAILAILDFILGNSATIDRLIRSRGTRALASAGDLHDWTR